MKVTLPKLFGLGFSVMLGGYVFVVAPQLPGNIVSHFSHAAGAGQARAPAPRSPGLFPVPGRKFVGIMTNSGPYDFTQLDRFTRAVGHQPSVYEFAQGWAVNRFDRSAIDKVARRGMLPLISWEPWNYQRRSKITSSAADQPAYSVSIQVLAIPGWRGPGELLSADSACRVAYLGPTLVWCRCA